MLHFMQDPKKLVRLTLLTSLLWWVIWLIFLFYYSYIYSLSTSSIIFPTLEVTSYLFYVFCVLQGALALEDALSKGLPIQTELEALNTYLEGIDKDSILDLVLSSLPEETLKSGTDTILQLNQKASYLFVSSLHVCWFLLF